MSRQGRLLEHLRRLLRLSGSGRDKKVQAAERGGLPAGSGWRSIGRGSADMTARSSEALYAAAARVSNTLACMPVHLYQGEAVAAEEPLERLISFAPNDRMTAYTWRQTMQVNMILSGNAYSIIRRGADGITPAALQVVDPIRVTPVLIDTLDAVWYRVIQEDGKIGWYAGTEIIHLRNISGTGLVGLSPRDILRETLDYDARVKRHGLQQLEGVNRGVVLTVPQTGLSPGQRDKLIKEFNDMYEESDGRVVLLQGGMTATAISQNAVDPKLLDAERIMRNRVATVNVIPPHMLGDYSDTSFATAEQTMQEYLQTTIVPYVTQWEEELARKLLTYRMVTSGYRFRFDMRALQRADTAAMAQKHSLGIRGGWITPNEARAEDGYPPVPGGDELIISRDLLPLKMVAEGATVDK